MAKIAVDIDDTIYSFRDIAKDALFYLAQKYDDKEILSAAYTEALQWRTMADVAGGEILAEAIELAHSSDVMHNQPAFRGAAQTVRALYDAGHEIIYISNRDEKSKHDTERWLEMREFPCPLFHNVEVKCLWGDKIPHLKDCQFIIDDRVSTLIRFAYDKDWPGSQYALDTSIADGRRIGFGLHAPHNTNLTDVPNIILAPTWAGLNYYLVRKGLLEEPAYDPFRHLKEN